MKKMYLLSALLGVVMASSCNSGEMSDVLPNEDSGRKIEFAENPYAISEDQAKEKALLFMQDLPKGMLRSSEMAEIADVSVETTSYDVTIVESPEEPGVKQKVPVYLINYKNASGENTGFVMMAGDERVADDVLVFSDNKGTDFDLTTGENSDFFNDLIAGYLHKSINDLEDVSEDDGNSISTRASSWHVTDYGDSRMCQISRVINFAQSGVPFNRYTPFVNGTRTLTGSAAVAMCQIMAYHDWPLKGAYKRYTTSTSGLQAYYPDYELTTAERAGILSSNMAYCEAFYPRASEYVANMMAEIGYKLGSSYGLTFTNQQPAYVPQVFAQMGYTTDGISNYSFAAIQRDIEERGLPVFMFGYSTGSVSSSYSHSFTINGTYYRDYKTNLREYILITHGNGSFYKDPQTGSGNSYFNKDMFSTTSVSTGYTPESSYDVMCPYRYNCKVITNITPNLNNLGSTNPNWVAN